MKTLQALVFPEHNLIKTIILRRVNVGQNGFRGIQQLDDHASSTMEQTHSKNTFGYEREIWLISALIRKTPEEQPSKKGCGRRCFGKPCMFFKGKQKSDSENAALQSSNQGSEATGIELKTKVTSSTSEIERSETTEPSTNTERASDAEPNASNLDVNPDAAIIEITPASTSPAPSNPSSDSNSPTTELRVQGMDTQNSHMTTKQDELKEFIKRTMEKLEAKDFPEIEHVSDAQRAVADMARSAKIHSVRWKDYLTFYPDLLKDENGGLSFDWLGYFQIELEYYPLKPGETNPENAEIRQAKNNITPMMIQQIPIKILKALEREYIIYTKNSSVFLDTRSPIFVCVVCTTMTGEDVQWTTDNIVKYQQEIGSWTELYSGHWEDYNEALYRDRIRGNLSNRTSELHFLRRNSGFLFLKPESFASFFGEDKEKESELLFLRAHFLKPVAEVRAMYHALNTINTSMDMLFVLKKNCTDLEDKIERLTNIQGYLSSKVDLIYSDRGSNKRSYYVHVLDFLLQEFQFDSAMERIHEKVRVFSRSMQIIHQKNTRLAQDTQNERIQSVNILLGLGVIASLADMLDNALNTGDGAKDNPNVYIAFLAVVGVVFLCIIFLWILATWKSIALAHKTRIRVEAIIRNEGKDQILMQRFRFGPYSGFLALPGGYLSKLNAKSKAEAFEALKTAVKKDVGVDIDMEKYVQRTRAPENDPRGQVVSWVFLCRTKSEKAKPSSDFVEAGFYPLGEVTSQRLAYNHVDVINSWSENQDTQENKRLAMWRKTKDRMLRFLDRVTLDFS